MSKPVVLKIYENSAYIGILVRSAKGYLFKYSPDYSGHGLSASLPKNNRRFASAELHPFFTNYISEGWYQETQKKHIDGTFSPTTKTLDLMALFGNCFGAIRFELVSPDKSSRAAHFSPNPQSEFKEIEPKVGQSEEAMIPGAQPKFLAVESEIPGHFRIASRGEISTHIAKITHRDYRFHKVLYNELLATKITEHLLPEDSTADLRLAPVEGVAEKSLVIKRFDRKPDGKKIPFYEFNQLLGKTTDEKYKGSYAEMADFIYEHSVPGGVDGFQCRLSDARKLFRRLLVDILIGNTDAHFKNFALIKKGSLFELTPNYDLVSSSMYGENRRERFTSFALKLGGTNALNLGAITAKRIVTAAYEFQIKPEELLEDVQALEQRKEDLARIMAPYEEEAPLVVKHFKETIRKRWNGSFAEIPKVLKNPPTNIFAFKRSRMNAETALDVKNPEKPSAQAPVRQASPKSP